jgi:hypothetical protein
MCPSVGECDECPSVVGWGVVWEGFEADHFREGRDCGWGELQLEVLLKVSEKAFHEYVGA